MGEGKAMYKVEDHVPGAFESWTYAYWFAGAGRYIVEGGRQ